MSANLRSVGDETAFPAWEDEETRLSWERLRSVLSRMGRVAVAVSGGLDSMTLAFAAHRLLSGKVEILHAVSPAVPPEATERVRRYAQQEGWNLRVLDAGEFEDPQYRENPSNRCFFCKSNLYSSISQTTSAEILSGTNLDDLQDFRPGLQAAEQHRVRHPFVEAKVDKRTVRAIARACGLKDVSELPASPCLSSRVETGIRIEADVLQAVHAVEQLVVRELKPKTVRCRVRRNGVFVELDAESYARLTRDENSTLRTRIERLLSSHGYNRPVAFAEYVTGSAFLR